MMQPQNQAQIQQSITQHGIAQGPQKLMDMEEEAATLAISTGIYVTYRTTKHNRADDCTRVGPKSLCFCGHTYKHHMNSRNNRKPCDNKKCKCKGYAFIPQRPEECGDWWLTRRRGFNVNNWKAKCKCGCAHDRHDPHLKHCRDCGCGMFNSNFLCIACDGHWHDHETLWENERERRDAKRSVGHAFKPLASTPGIREHVIGNRKGTGKGKGRPKQNEKSLEEQWESGEITAQEYQALVAEEEINLNQGESKTTTTVAVANLNRNRTTRPRDNRRPERSVRLSGKASGGTATGRVANRWGKMASNDGAGRR